MPAPTSWLCTGNFLERLCLGTSAGASGLLCKFKRLLALSMVQSDPHVWWETLKMLAGVAHKSSGPKLKRSFQITLKTERQEYASSINYYDPRFTSENLSKDEGVTITG